MAAAAGGRTATVATSELCSALAVDWMRPGRSNMVMPTGAPCSSSTTTLGVKRSSSPPPAPPAQLSQDSASVAGLISAFWAWRIRSSSSLRSVIAPPKAASWTVGSGLPFESDSQRSLTTQRSDAGDELGSDAEVRRRTSVGQRVQVPSDRGSAMPDSASSSDDLPAD
jgi:hypothetical protein